MPISIRCFLAHLDSLLTLWPLPGLHILAGTAWPEAWRREIHMEERGILSG